MTFILFAGLPYSGMNAAVQRLRRAHGYERVEDWTFASEPVLQGVALPPAANLTQLRRAYQDVRLGDEKFLADVKRNVVGHLRTAASVRDLDTFILVRENFPFVYPAWIDSRQEIRFQRYLEKMGNPNSVRTLGEYRIEEADEARTLRTGLVRAAARRRIENNAGLPAFYEQLRVLSDIALAEAGEISVPSLDVL